MQIGDKAREQLDKARGHLHELKVAYDVNQIERLWKMYLHDLERIWFKALAHYGKSPKWSGWHGHWARLREADELVAYLRRARDADEHTVAEILETKLGNVAIRAIDPSQGAVIKPYVDKNGVMVGYEATPNTEVQITPAAMELLPIENRGKSYPVPTKHRGRKVDPQNIVELAEAGLAFYSEFLAAAEAHFVK